MLTVPGSVAAIYTWWYLWSRKRMRSRNATGRSRTANGWTWRSSWPMNMFTRRIETSCERTWAKRSRASRSIVTKRFILCWRRNTKFSILLQVLQLIHPCRNISPNFDCTSLVNKNGILETELSVQWIEVLKIIYGWWRSVLKPVSLASAGRLFFIAFLPFIVCLK